MQVSKPRHPQRQKGQRRAEHREHRLPEMLTGEIEIDPHGGVRSVSARKTGEKARNACEMLD